MFVSTFVALSIHHPSVPHLPLRENDECINALHPVDFDWGNRQPLSSVVGWPSVLARALPCGDLQQGGSSHTAVAATPAPTDCRMQVRLDRPKVGVPNGFVEIELTLDDIPLQDRIGSDE